MKWNYISRNIFADTTLLNGKNADRIDFEKKKSALGDIDKNAPNAVGLQLANAKKVEIEIKDEEYVDREPASSTDVDYHDVWAQKLTLTDEEINRWIDMLNTARTMNPYDETEPPPPMPEEELIIQIRMFFSIFLYSISKNFF